MAPINKFLEAFNKGTWRVRRRRMPRQRTSSSSTRCLPTCGGGPQAFQTWAADLASDDKKQGVTDQKVSLGAATRVETDGVGAYVVVPSVYTFKRKGVAMREAAQMTFTLKKSGSAWLIHGWTWTGPMARKVTGAATK
jgi:hypothetical protein